MNSQLQSGKARNIFSEPLFEISPKLFNGVEVGRICRQEQEIYAISHGNLVKDFLSVKTCVIHDDGTSTRHNRQKVELKPILKKRRVGCSGVSFRCKGFATTIRRYDVCSCILAPALCILNFYAT